MADKIAYTDKDIIAAIVAATTLIADEDFKLLIGEYPVSDDGWTTELLFSLRDEAEVNMGNIEDDTFNTLADVIDRMGIYHNDYVYGEYAERVKNGARIDANSSCLRNVLFLNSDFCADLLGEITANTYLDFQPRLEEFSSSEALRYLIDKSIALKIFETLSAQKIAENNGKIYVSHYNAPFDSDADFLATILADSSFDDYFVYDTYQDVVESEKSQVLEDALDLGLYEDKSNRKWSFYLSKEELIYLGLFDEIEDFLSRYQ